MTEPGAPAAPAARAGFVRAVALGVVAGALAGLFGVGGGILVVPGLVLMLGMDQRLAHGTSLAAIVPIAAAGVIGYSVEGSVDWAVAIVLAATSSLGAVLGTHALHVLPVKALAYAFSALLLATAIRLFVAIPDATGRSELDLWMVVSLAVLGTVTGTLSGLLGVGGGIAMVPGQILLFGIPDAIAKGTSLAVIIPTAIVGTIRNLRRHNADLRIATAVGLAGVVSSFLASLVSVNLDPTVSSVSFAALLTLVAIRLLYTTQRVARTGAAGGAEE